ncbi:MAG: cytochrome c oxidase subunit I, partial [Sulfurovum sp.]
DYLPEFEIYHKIAFIGAIIFILGLIYMFYVLIQGWRKGEKATPNPWNATTLEWHLPTSPPPLENHTKVPYVDFRPYEYYHGEPVVKFNYNTMQRID